jgi:outer membrane protein assembly factor BamA
MRVNFTAGTSTDFSNSRFDSYLLSGDYRLYLRIARRAGFATRLFGFYSGGDRPQRVNLGGTLGIRGYPLYGYILGSRAFMVNEELRFPILDFLTLGAPFGALRFPEIQGALFADIGKASFSSAEHRALLGSYGLSFRWPLTPLAVLRLDWGRRFTDNNYQGYGLSSRQTKRSFVAFFFGYNY